MHVQSQQYKGFKQIKWLLFPLKPSENLLKAKFGNDPWTLHKCAVGAHS